MLTVKTPKFFCAAVVCMLAFNASAALFEDDEARRAILDLRQKVEASQLRTVEELRRSSEENAQLRRSLLDLSNQIDFLRNDMAVLRGQNEQLTRGIADVQRSQKDVAQSVEERFQKFEPAKVSLDGREFEAEPAEKQEFEAALANLRKGDFSAAQAAYTTFLKRYPQSGYKSSSLFWLGNAQYALRDYKSAAGNFRVLATSDPQHPRSPEALLSMANCQIELKDAKAARKILEDIVTAYPQSEAASAAKERLVKLK